MLTVFMPVYNGEKYLHEAIDSILNQSYRDFIFLIINDGSTDKSDEIIKSYKDKRIKYLVNNGNKGLPFTRNLGLGLSDTKYLAFQDCDDISLPRRLGAQVEYLEKHPNIGVLGGWMKIIGNKNRYVSRYFTSPNDIRANFIFFTSLAQPTAMINNELFKKYNLCYDQNFPIAEDYELWIRALKYFDFANLPKVLIKYRVHANSISKSGITNQSALIKAKLLNKLGINPNDEELLLHCASSKPAQYTMKDYLAKTEAWLIGLKTANLKTKVYNTQSLDKIISNRWLEICYANLKYDRHTWKIFRKSSLRKNKDLNKIKILKFIIKRLSRSPKD